MPAQKIAVIHRYATNVHHLGALAERWSVVHYCDRCSERVDAEDLVLHSADHERDGAAEVEEEVIER